MSPGGAGSVPPALTVRELRWSDFDAIRETYLRLYDERESNPEIGIHLFAVRPSYADEVAWFANLYRSVLSGEAVVSVGVRDGVVVGHCTVRRLYPGPDSETAHNGVLGIVVDAPHRGTGVGRAILADALRQCVGRFEVVRLSVFATNRRARKLYEEFGFVYVGTMPRMVHRGDRYIDEELMVTTIGPPNR